jgi:hypothetical protein
MSDPRLDQESRERAKALYEEEVGDPPRSVRDVAGLMGLSVSRTHQLLRDAGAKMRPPGGQKRKDGDGDDPQASSSAA